MRHFTLYLLFSITVLNSLNAQWESLGSGTTTTPRTYFGLEVVDAQTIWAITLNPSATTIADEVIKTTNGGQTWAVMNIPVETGAYRTLDIQAIDENTAWVLMVNIPAQDKAKIFKTTDGGINWTEQMGEFNDAGQAMATFHFYNENEGLAFGSPGTGDTSIDKMHVYTTIDGGTTWVKTPDSSLPETMYNDAYWLYSGNGSYETKGDTLWYVTRKSQVLRTIDRGQNWEVFQTGILAGTGLTSIAFSDHLNGIVVGAQPNGAARTEDGGETWIEISIPTLPIAGLIEYIPDTENTYVISSGGFFTNSLLAITRDNGTTWPTINYDDNIGSIQFLSPTVGFAGGNVSTSQNKGLFKWTGDLSDPFYVNHAASGANDGTTWENAFTDLQTALAIADSSSQIWVAQGTYKPSSPSMHPDSTLFQDTVGVKLYGGFEGVETIIEQRDIVTYPTILSGDLLGDDIPNSFTENRNDNTRHLLSIIHSNRSLVDGFTITGGNALIGQVFGNIDYIGGGLLALADIDVNNCIFIDNQGGQGAGMVWENNNFTISNSSFLQNNSTFGAFLAVGAIGDPSLISGNRFEDNHASGFGGAATVANMDVIIENNIFENNSSQSEGGALLVFVNGFTEGGKNISVFNNDFINNESTLYGGAFSFNNFNHTSTLYLNDCLFEGNSAGVNGGGAALNNLDGGDENSIYSASFFLEDNIFLNNTAQFGGGLKVVNTGDSLLSSIVSCVFENNSAMINGGAANFEVGASSSIDLSMDKLLLIGNNATEQGGGLYLDVKNPCQLLNTEISENEAGEGAGIYLKSSSNMLVENVLMANNIGAPAIDNKDSLHLIGVTSIGNIAGFYQDGDAFASFQNTIMANDENYLGGSINIISRGGNLSSDATLAAVFTTTGEFQDFNETDPLLDSDFIPTSSSPCIDTGNPAGITQEEDLDGNDRIKGAQIDMGAFETPFSTPTIDLSDFITLEVFPNPFTSEIHITSDTPVLSLKLMDITGKLLIESYESTSLKGLKVLPTASYLLKIVTEKGVRVMKIIKS